MVDVLTFDSRGVHTGHRRSDEAASPSDHGGQQRQPRRCAHQDRVHRDQNAGGYSFQRASPRKRMTSRRRSCGLPGTPSIPTLAIPLRRQRWRQRTSRLPRLRMSQSRRYLEESGCGGRIASQRARGVFGSFDAHRRAAERRSNGRRHCQGARAAARQTIDACRQQPPPISIIPAAFGRPSRKGLLS